MSSELILIGIAVVIVLGVAAQWIAWRFQLPSILLLLVFGFVAGPVTGDWILDPQHLQGEWLFSFVSLSVGIILFEAGLSLRLSELREVGRAVRNLITVGVLVTWTLAGLGAHYIVGFSAELAILVGAILTVTGPTVIIPLLHHVRPVGRSGTVAKWEGVIIDPIGAILSVLVLETILLLSSGSSGSPTLHALSGLFQIILVGSIVSALGVGLLILLLRHRLVPDYLRNSIALMTVVGAFSLSNTLQHESGLLTTTLMGFMMVNQPYVPVRQIGEFKEDLRVVLLAGLFILLSARLELSVVEYFDLRAFIFLAVLILLVRPLTVLISSFKTRLNWTEVTFLSWLAPRGVVAAAVASLFAFRLEEYYPEEAAYLTPIVFLVIVGTVAVYGLTLGPLARWLGLADQNPQGVLFLGAHAWARKIAKAVDERGFVVLLVDSNIHNVQLARQEGLLAEQANALSEDIIDDLDLSGIGRLVALTPNAEVNSLAALHFSEVFESADLYQIATRSEGRQEREGELPRHLRGNLLFGGITHTALETRFQQGDEVRPFELSEERDYADLREHYEDQLLPLFLIRGQNHLWTFSEEGMLSPQPGDTVLALVSPTGQEESWKPEEAAAPARQHGNSPDEGFEELIQRAPLLDLENITSYTTLVRRVSNLLAENLPVSSAELVTRYLGGRWQERTIISHGTALSHFRMPDIDQPELVIVRSQTKFNFSTDELPDSTDPVHALFFLIGPEDHPGRHLHVLAQLASRIDDDTFLDEWCTARDEEQLRSILLSLESAPPA